MFGMILVVALRLLNPCIEPPPLEDADRFPPAVIVDANVAWADAHLKWLEAQAALDLVHVQFWEGWLRDARACRQPWQELQLARDVGYDNDWRRRRLDDLHGLIGDEAYAAGRMSSVVPPLWRFRER